MSTDDFFDTVADKSDGTKLCGDYSKIDDGIPRVTKSLALLFKTTGWRLVAVPDHMFFEHLANCHFPVTVWLREPEEFD